MFWTRLSVVFSLLVGVLVVVAGAEPAPVGAVPAQVSADGYTNPAVWIGTSPFVLKDGSTYYQYVDGFVFGRIPIAESTDLDSWAWPGAQAALPVVPSWAQPEPQKFTGPSVAHIPANPGVDQDYVLYFTGQHTGDDDHPVGQRCIGLAVADSPTGPFMPEDEPLICPDDGSDVMDPSPAPIAGGLTVRTLVYQQTGAEPGIYTQMLEASGLALSPRLAARRIFVAPDTPEPGQNDWLDGVVERPSVAIGTDNVAWLFFSGTDPSTNRQAVGRVKCLTFGVILSCQPPSHFPDTPLGVYPADGGRWFGSTDHVADTGRAQVFSDGNQSWITYQGSAAADCAGETCTNTHTYLDKLCFTDLGPRTNAPTTGLQTRDPSAATCEEDVPAEWQATAAQHLEAGAGARVDVDPLPDECGEPAPPQCDRHVDMQFPEDGLTFRQVLHTTSGGSSLRVRLSNRYGSVPLTIEDASVALTPAAQTSTSTIAGPATELTFGGRDSVDIAPGSEVVSDAVSLPGPVPAGHDLAVSLYVPEDTYIHPGGNPWLPPTSSLAYWLVPDETTFGTVGNHVDDTTLTNVMPPVSLIVAAVDLYTTDPGGAVVVIGDSISDGFSDALSDGSGGSLDAADDEHPETVANWTYVLDERLRDPEEGRATTSVFEMGRAGGTLGPESEPVSGVARLDREALSLTGVRTVIVELGANDIAGWRGALPEENTAEAITDEEREAMADAITADLQALIQRAHDAGVQVVGMTIPPVWWPNKVNGVCTYADKPENTDHTWVRTTVNDRILDGVIPFDAVADFGGIYAADNNPEQLDLDLVGGDCVHPGPDGRIAIANTIDLDTL